MVGLCLVAALAIRIETASHGEVTQTQDGEWMIVPDLLGDGFWLIDEQGQEYWVDQEGWMTIGDCGFTMTLQWPWIQWLPMPTGKVSAAAGVG